VIPGEHAYLFQYGIGGSWNSATNGLDLDQSSRGAGVGIYDNRGVAGAEGKLNILSTTSGFRSMWVTIPYNNAIASKVTYEGSKVTSSSFMQTRVNTFAHDNTYGAKEFQDDGRVHEGDGHGAELHRGVQRLQVGVRHRQPDAAGNQGSISVEAGAS